MFVDFQWILMQMGVLVHPQLGLLCGAALPVFFSQKNTHFNKTYLCIFMIFELCFIKIDLICY